MNRNSLIKRVNIYENLIEEEKATIKWSKTSPAKLNLFLYVSGRDEQSYHILQSLFCLLPDLYDTLVFEESNQLEVISHIKDNLIEKAARAYGINNLKISLNKIIPVGSGLGGGSSNAATTLFEIGKRLNLTRKDLISKKIGDDVEFFLYEKNAIYFDSKNGYEILLGLDLHLIVITPDFGIATKDVYDLMRQEIRNEDLLPVVDREQLKYYIFNGENQLYPFANRIEPRITYVMNEIAANKGVIASRMSGSGSSCFGIFESYESAIFAKEVIKGNNPKWLIHYFNLKI
jgi:4-diphosphocytidyl-2-C-methyl-D-erythritol kinase